MRRRGEGVVVLNMAFLGKFLFINFCVFQREENTVGLVIERERLENETDGLR